MSERDPFMEEMDRLFARVTEAQRNRDRVLGVLRAFDEEDTKRREPETMFDIHVYEAIHERAFRPGYPGYKPEVKEIPNGDGKVDAEKRYSHVAPKYLTEAVSPGDKAVLMTYLQRAHDVATIAATDAGVPAEFMPDIRYGALRILDYPPGSVSNPHEDFDLFTLMCYRDQPDRFLAHDDEDAVNPFSQISAIRRHNKQAHLGQLGEAIGLGKATPHEVLASESRQCSIVYFAIPNHDSLLPPTASGTRLTVRDWLNERMARSRTAFDKYK